MGGKNSLWGSKFGYFFQNLGGQHFVWPKYLGVQIIGWTKCIGVNKFGGVKIIGGSIFLGVILLWEVHSGGA